MSLQLKKHSSRSVNYYAKVLIILLISILLINVVVTFYTIKMTRQQNIESITNTINLYLDDTQLRLNAVDHFMIWTIKNEPLIDDIEQAKDMSELPQSIHTFRSRVIDFQYSTGKKYQFFLELKNEDYFFNGSPLEMTYSEYLQMRNYFTSEKRTANRYEDIYTWKSFKMKGLYYLYHLLEYEDRTFISLIAVDDILQPLQELNLGDKGKIFIENNANGFIYGEQTDLKDSKRNSIFSSVLTFKQEESGLPFTLYVSVDHFSAFERTVITQIALVLVTILIGLAFFLILSYFRRKVLSPIQDFSRNLSELNARDGKTDLSNSIIELEQANELFKGLMWEINKLKIDYYEQEFEKNQIQMDFMKLQIKPHFYLSCLTTIHSMAELEMYKEIKQMTISISNYFRYLFQTNQSYVKLKDEIKHIQDYLAIQKLLHAQSFKFNIQIEPTLNQVLVPPLMVQTFIENTVKHAISLDEQITIILHIYLQNNHNKQYIVIDLHDNGPGFPTDVLDKLKNNIPLTDETGNHIGINNIVQRLRLLFEEDFQIEFSNTVDGGARVHILIPYLAYEEDEK